MTAQARAHTLGLGVVLAVFSAQAPPQPSLVEPFASRVTFGPRLELTGTRLGADGGVADAQQWELRYDGGDGSGVRLTRVVSPAPVRFSISPTNEPGLPAALGACNPTVEARLRNFSADASSVWSAFSSTKLFDADAPVVSRPTLAGPPDFGRFELELPPIVETCSGPGPVQTYWSVSGNELEVEPIRSFSFDGGRSALWMGEGTWRLFVRADDDAQNRSAIVEAATPVVLQANPALTPPLNLALTGGTVTPDGVISWTMPPGAQSAVIIALSDAGSLLALERSASSPARINGLVEGRLTEARVALLYDAGVSPWAVSARFIFDATPPAAPAPPRALWDGGLVEVTWSTVVDTETAVASYELLRASDDLVFTPVASPTLPRATLPAVSGSWHYEVLAIDLAGNRGPPSLPVALWVDVTAPSQPTLSLVSLDGGAVTMAWTPSVDAPDAAVNVQYELERRLESDGGFSLVARGTALSHVDSVGAGTWRWRVRSLDAFANASGWSAPLVVSIVTADAGLDAGTADAGTADAGTPDAGTPDAGTPDAGTPDAGVADSGVADAGLDAGTDAGVTPDAGPVDAGPVDAGHAEPDAGDDAPEHYALSCGCVSDAGLAFVTLLALAMTRRKSSLSRRELTSSAL